MTDIGDVVAAQHHVLGTDAYLIFIVALILVERVVLVDILNVGEGLVAGVVTLGLLVVVGRVALRHVDALVTLEDAGTTVVQVAATEVVVVIVGRVGVPCLAHAVLYGHAVEEVAIGGIGTLLVVRQTVESDVLLGTGTAGSGEGIGLRGLDGNLTPLGLHEAPRTVDGHAALVELLAVTQDILADFTQVNAEVAAIQWSVGRHGRIDEGVEQPELDVLDVGLLEVVGVQLSHHTAPAILRVVQLSLARNIGTQVVRATLGGIVCQVEDGQRIGSTAIGGLVAVGVQLVDIHRTDIVVGQLLQVALDMAGRQTAGAIGEERVDGVPRQQGAVLATGDARLVGRLAEVRRRTTDDPRLRFNDADAVLGVLEVVNVGSIVLRAAGGACDEVSKLAREGDGRRCGTVQQGQLVEHVGEPLRLGLPVDVQTPQGVLQRLGAHGNLGGERLLGEMLQRTANLEVLGEVVLPVDTEHSLALHAVVVVRLQRHTDVGTGIDDALVEDGHLTGRVVDGIVAAFRQQHAAGRHAYGTLRYIVSTQRDDVGRSALVLTYQTEAVLVRHLAGSGLGGVVQLVEGILLGLVVRYAVHQQEILQRATEGLDGGEEYATLRYGIALDVVEEAVGVCLVVIVQAVAAQASQQGDVLDLGNVVEVNAGRVALVLDVQTELGLLDIRSQIVDVLHHQSPVDLLGIVAGILQGLDVESLVGIGMLGGKLTDLVRSSAIGIFEGNGQHLVGLQGGLQRDITQGLVQGIFRRGQQSGGSQLLVVGAADIFARQHAAGLIDVTGSGIGGGNLSVLTIGRVLRQVRLHTTTPLR